MSTDSSRPLSPETLAAQALGEVDEATGALVPPIHTATTYERTEDGVYHDGRVYTRADNPTYDTAERLLARLEGGAASALFASGNAAITAVFQALVPGDHVLVSRVLYWGVRKWLAEFAATWGLDVEFVDTTDPAAVAAAIRPGQTRLLWLETPANPMWDVSDLAALSAIAHAADVRVAVDNTVSTPVLTRPIEFGADLVVHSATKYLNGHSDVLAGAVVTARADPFWERIRSWRRNAGSVIGPFEAWLLQRGMRTLFVRVQRASASALQFALHFEGHPALRAVLYPGLPSHHGHAIAARQMTGGFGGMLSVRVAASDQQTLGVANAVRVFRRATSLGGVESLVEARRIMEGPSSPVPGDLLRLSIGLEAVEDLIADFENALRVVELAGRAGSSAPATEQPAQPAEPPDLAAVRAAVERSVGPLVIARGGAVRLASVQDGVVTLEASGSPGAVLPIAQQIERQLRAAAPAVAHVDIRWPETTSGPLPAAPPDLASRVQAVLDQEINPAVAAHRGHIALVSAADGQVSLRMEGGCQGCALAEMTLRQGIQPLLRTRIPELVAVVDVTDHACGQEPYFAAQKR